MGLRNDGEAGGAGSLIWRMRKAGQSNCLSADLAFLELTVVVVVVDLNIEDDGASSSPTGSVLDGASGWLDSPVVETVGQLNFWIKAVIVPSWFLPLLLVLLLLLLILAVLVLLLSLVIVGGSSPFVSSKDGWSDGLYSNSPGGSSEWTLDASRFRVKERLLLGPKVGMTKKDLDALDVFPGWVCAR